jgi:WASH complex subunit CCDC53
VNSGISKPIYGAHCTFLIHFSTVHKEKQAELSLHSQQIETTLNILNAKLSSMPGLDNVMFEVSPLKSVTSITNGSHSEATSEQSQNSTQLWTIGK